MTNTRTFELARRIRQLVSTNKLEEALKVLHHYFFSIDDTHHLDDVVLLESRLTELTQNQRRNLLTDTEFAIALAKIKHSVLLLLDEISPEVAIPSESKPLHKGKLLHNIPGSMQVGDLIDCRIRIATKEKYLRKHFPSAADVEPILLDRIGERMEIRLESTDSEAFIIKQQNPHLVQIIEPDIHTEWAFDVIPIKEGKQRLNIKVSIILEQKGAIIHRDEVITIKVAVNTEQPTAQGEWQIAAELQKDPSSKSLGERAVDEILGSGEVKALRRVASIAVVAIALAAATVFLPNLNNLIENYPLITPCDPNVRTVRSIVQAPGDTLRTLTISSGRADIFQVGPYVWGVNFFISPDSVEHRIHFQGKLKSHDWVFDTFPDPLILFVPKDQSEGLKIYVDKVLNQLYSWKLVVKDGPMQVSPMIAYPLSETRFFVPLSPQQISAFYDTSHTYIFGFENETFSSNTSADNKHLRADGGILRFLFKADNPNEFNNGTIISIDSCIIRLNTTITVKYPAVFVNHVEINEASKRLQFKTQTSEKITIALTGENCRCKEIVNFRPTQDTTLHIECVRKSIPPPVPATNITIILDDKWKPLKGDLRLLIQSHGSTNERFFVNDMLTFSWTQPDRSPQFCIQFDGSKSQNKMLELDCLNVKIHPGDITLKLTNRNQLEQVR